MKHFLLFYQPAENYLERRPDFRDQHLQKCWASHEAGRLVLGGVLVDPLDQAVLLFTGDSASVAEDFARSDPYVVNALVKSWHVREWSTVAGNSASSPVYPSSPINSGRVV